MVRMHPVTVLILAELGLAAGCRHAEAETTMQPEPEAPPRPAAASTEPPPVAPTATAASSPSATPSALAVSPPADHRPCRSGKECPAGQRCMLPFDGHHTVPGVGQCWTGPMPGGRPLLVDGRAHVARVSRGLGWAGDLDVEISAEVSRAWATVLREDALAEHASIAAFARTLCQLLAIGAPAWLLERTTAALHDEIRHAKECFRWAARLGGTPVSPGPLPEATAPISGDRHELVRDVIHGGCIGETLAACEAHARIESAPLSGLQDLYRAIAGDEARHAALAFDTVRWLVGQDPTAAAVVAEGRERFYATASAEALSRIAPMLSAL